jgi:hypothetical protein
MLFATVSAPAITNEMAADDAAGDEVRQRLTAGKSAPSTTV